MDELKLPKTKAALAEYDRTKKYFQDQIAFIAGSEEEIDKFLKQWDTIQRAVFTAFAEETKDRNSADIVEYMVIDEWLRNPVAKYGGP
jgi:hypothetical protein